MPLRLAACEPCRSSKLACDHVQPICSRCRETNQTGACKYRERPFKRKRGSLDAGFCRVSSPGTRVTVAAEACAAPSRYPNTGYRGVSSHATIFGQLPSEDASTEREEELALSERFTIFVDKASVRHGADLIKQCRSFTNIAACRKLIETWTKNGVNLALAGPFTQCCADAAGSIFDRLLTCEEKAEEISRMMFLNSCRPLKYSADTTLADLSSDFNRHSPRWETLGIFFTSVSRAAVEFTDFESLYATTSERRSLQRFAMQVSDRCLETVLSLDCLNDLQLVLQYENFIVHSYIDGDSSYQSWRRLGDVISSLFALGYHEHFGNDSISNCVKDLRRATFARAYSADKNLAIFMGRPPRLSRRYCRIQLPGSIVEVPQGTAALQEPVEWPTHVQQDSEIFDYVTETQWSAICALLKEEVLDLFREENFGERAQKATTIQARAESQWRAFPPGFCLEGPLRMCHRKPIVRDFLVSARLNYLHVLLLLRMSVTRHVPAQDSEIIAISASMLSLTVEALILKNHLANSGTGLIWRVAYYGLPAAGITCLSLLENASMTQENRPRVFKAFQDLSVFVAEVEAGEFAYQELPNHAVLAEATRTIKSILNRVLFKDLKEKSSSQISNVDVRSSSANPTEQEWLPWPSQDVLDFEMDFWLNLAEHPTLIGTCNEIY